MKVYIRSHNRRPYAVAYVHGCCLHNGDDERASAGAGFHFGSGNKYNGACSVLGRQTSQRAQLAAAVQALTIIGQNCRGRRAMVHTNADYVEICAGRAAEWEANGWRNKSGRPVPNADLVEELVNAVAMFDDVHWVVLNREAKDRCYVEARKLSRDMAFKLIAAAETDGRRYCAG